MIFQDWGLRAMHETRFSQQRLAVALGNVEGGTLSKCPMSWHNLSFLHLPSPSPVGRAGGVLKPCCGGLHWGAWISMPGPVSVEEGVQGQAQLWQWPPGQGGVGTAPGDLVPS